MGLQPASKAASTGWVDLLGVGPAPLRQALVPSANGRGRDDQSRDPAA
jgi:hypothetical protein